MGILRFILALTVAYAHGRGTVFGHTIFGGDLSVQSFFVFSGFYITMVLCEKYQTLPNGTLSFYKNRILRLFPTYWIVVLLTVFVALIMNSTPYAHQPLSELKPHWDGLSWVQQVLLTLSNLFMVGQDWIMYLGWKFSGTFGWTSDFRATEFPAWRFLLLPHGWSLGLEISFYLVAPFLVTRKIGVLIAAFSASIVTRIVLWKLGYSHDPWSYRFFPNELALFLAGALSYRTYAVIRSRWKSERATKVIHILGWSCICASLICIARFHFIPLPLIVKKIICYSSFALAIPFMFEATKNITVDQYFGDLAYPVYVTHIVIYLAFKDVFRDQVWISTIIVIGMSALLVRWVERPIAQIRRRSSSQLIHKPAFLKASTA